MRFENVNGVEQIILETNDKIKVTTEENSIYSIDIEYTDEGLNISGASSLINKISGYGMLEKVIVPPPISAENIRKKCDEWLENFKVVHDKFRELVLTEKYHKQEVYMELSFSDFSSFSGGRGMKIDLDLKRMGSIIQEGMTITIDDINASLAHYLLACVLNHYISSNYANSPIDLDEYNYRQNLYSNEKENNWCPIIAKMGGIDSKSGCNFIITSIITSHNLGSSSDQIIANLKRNIHNQPLHECFESGIKHSNKQLEYINTNL